MWVAPLNGVAPARHEVRRACESLLHGTPGEVRTHDLRIRNPLLYPAELRGCNKKVGIMLTDGALVNPRGTAVSRWGGGIDYDYEYDYD